MNPSAEQLRVKSGKTMLGTSVERALANFAEEVTGANEVGQSIAARVLPDLQGKGLCGKEAFLLT